MKELHITVVIKESQRILSEISNSVGPDSSTKTSLERIDIFLKETEKEVQTLPRNKEKHKLDLAFLTVAIAPLAKMLLRELWAKAIAVIEHLRRI